MMYKLIHRWPLHGHAKNALQTFNAHFISIMCGAYKSCQLHLGAGYYNSRIIPNLKYATTGTLSLTVSD